MHFTKLWPPIHSADAGKDPHRQERHICSHLSKEFAPPFGLYVYVGCTLGYNCEYGQVFSAVDSGFLYNAKDC